MIDCKHELPMDQCFDCKVKPYDGPYWDAQYEGICTACKNVIDIGALVRWDREGVGVMHAAHK